MHFAISLGEPSITLAVYDTAAKNTGLQEENPIEQGQVSTTPLCSFEIQTRQVHSARVALWGILDHGEGWPLISIAALTK